MNVLGRRKLCIILSLLAVFVTAAVFCAGAAFAAPPQGILDETNASVQAVIAVQKDVTPELMAQEGVLGTAVGLDGGDSPALVVYVDRDCAGVSGIVRSLPPAIRGVAVKAEITDKFRAFKRPSAPTEKVSHTAKQTPPIQLGTSGGWGLDLANGYCCGGTLGSLIQVNGTKYILSNYHVFESDIVSGGNSRVATDLDPIIQPGLIDVSCNYNNAQVVAKLVKLSSLPGSNVDCSVAEVVSGMVRTDGTILEIGTISSTTVAPVLKKAVKKSGRTSGLTRSTISGINGTIYVTYDNECAGGTAFTKMFENQIVIANKASKFLKGGDSGSLLVEDVTTNPKAVGLLYAGSSTAAIANPIAEVLSFVGSALDPIGKTPATMVGN